MIKITSFNFCYVLLASKKPNIDKNLGMKNMAKFLQTSPGTEFGLY